jgi:hypothetical protein
LFRGIGRVDFVSGSDRENNAVVDRNRTIFYDRGGSIHCHDVVAQDDQVDACLRLARDRAKYGKNRY